MSPRARRALLAGALVVACLFAGRWTAGILADRWWGASISPAAAAFLTDLALLRLTLDAAGALVAAAWFIGNLLLVYRAIGAVEVSRRIANLEVRERLTPQLLIGMVVGAGTLMGVVTGGDLSRYWTTVALAWQGVTVGLADPYLGHDAGAYVAQLPLWHLLHAVTRTLVLLGLLATLLLYAVVGALRWIDGRPAINDHARQHTGWLLAALALVLAWGAWLDPALRAGGIDGVPGAQALRLAVLLAPTLAGVCLATAALSLVWAYRARHALLLASWVVTAVAFLVGRGILGALVEPEDVPAGTVAIRAQMDAAAYGLQPVEEGPLLGAAREGEPPARPALWQIEPLVRLVPADTQRTVATDAAWLDAGGARRPAWLVLRAGAAPAGPVLEAIADDRLSPFGDPLYYRAADSQPAPVPVPFLALDADALHPGASPQRLGGARGIVAGRWLRRLALAWARQEGDLLAAGADPASRLEWERRPEDRLRRLAPWAEWTPPQPRVVEGRLVWVADGYVTARFFPLASRTEAPGGTVGSLRAALVGAVWADDGSARVVARPDGGPLADAWTALARGVVEPWDSLPAAVRAALPYPALAFDVHTRLLESPGLGTRLADGIEPQRPPPHEYLWLEPPSSPARVAAFVRGTPGELSALVLGAARDGLPQLVIRRADSLAVLPAPGALERLWLRFASFTLLADSLREAGVTLEPGRPQLWLAGDRLGAYQVWYRAQEPMRDVSVAWVAAAVPGHLGAGRTPAEAWSNLRGVGSPLDAPDRSAPLLAEARRLVERADSALRAGDLAAFGRAFEALRLLLGTGRAGP